MTNQTPTIAPDGVLFVFLAIAAGRAIPTDQIAEDWLATNGLIGPDETLVVGLTARGRAWLTLITAVPLPVQVTSWLDPRGGEAPRTIALDDLAGALGKALAPLLAARPAPAPVARPSSNLAPVRVSLPAEMGEDGFPEVDPLPGFVAPGQSMRTTLPGQTPPGFMRDDTVIVQRRSGKVSGERGQLTVGQVIWGELGTGDDVLYFRKNDRPADETPGTRVG